MIKDKKSFINKLIWQVNNEDSLQPYSKQKKKKQVKTNIKIIKVMKEFNELMQYCLKLCKKDNEEQSKKICKVSKQYNNIANQVINCLNQLENKNFQQIFHYYLQILKQIFEQSLTIKFHSESNSKFQFVQKAKIQNIKLEKSIQLLTKQFNKSKQTKFFQHKYIQTELICQPKKSEIQKQSMIRRYNSSVDNQIKIVQQKQKHCSMIKQQYQAVCIRYLEQIQRLRSELQNIKLKQKIIIFKTLVKKNPVEFYCTRLKLKNYDNHTRKPEQKKIRIPCLFLQYDSIKHKIDNGSIQRKNLQQHPFWIIRTIRTIFDSLTIDMRYHKGRFNFDLYVNNWFRKYEMIYEICKRNKDLQIDKLNLITALKDYNLSKLWDILLFRQLLDNKYETDQIFFMIKVREILIKQPLVNLQSGSEIIFLISFQDCKQAIYTAFKKYPIIYCRSVIEKLSKSQIKIKKQYKVDYAFALRLLMDFYKEIKSEKYNSFIKLELYETNFLLFDTFRQLIKKYFENLSEYQIDKIFTEITHLQIYSPEKIWKYCTQNGYFNNKIIVLSEEFPKIKNIESFTVCLDEYDKITPLISSFRKHLINKGSLYFMELNQSLELNGKLALTDLKTIFKYFISLQRLISQSLLNSILNVSHNHKRDDQLQCSMLHALLRSISAKLTVWKKINLADCLHHQYVINCVKKIQRTIKKKLTTNEKQFSQFRKKLDQQS